MVAVGAGVALESDLLLESSETISFPEAAISESGFAKEPASMMTKKQVQVAAKPISVRCVFFIKFLNPFYNL